MAKGVAESSLRLPTLRTVLSFGLPLVVLAGEERLDTPIRWVAVSELEDPTPYLEGGELLLTTGIRLTPRKAKAYVHRLVAADVAALGFGIGLTHATTPTALVTAAQTAGLPLLEVPEPTPFIAISQAVSQWLAAADTEAISRAAAAQRDLTRAALAPDGTAAVVARLARDLGARVAVLDAAGRPVHASPVDVADLVAVATPHVQRLRGHGPKAAASFDAVAEAVVVHPLGAAGRVRGFLVVARAGGFGAADHQLISVGVALLSLAVDRTAGTDPVLRDLRRAVFALLVDGIAPHQLPLDSVGWTEVLSGHVRVLVADGAAPALGAAQDALDDVTTPDSWHAVARHDGLLVAVIPDADPVVQAVLEAGPTLRWGVSDPVLAEALGTGWRQARRALAASGQPGVRRFAELTREGVVGLVDPEAARGFADRLLQPLEARDRGDLVMSVRAWLAHHGQWDAAAHALGIHRHTLRYRMKRVEELLGRGLDDPDLRADLWVALAVRDRDVGTTGAPR